MEKYYALVEVSWYNEYSDALNKSSIDHVVLTDVSSFADAMVKMEEYYGNDLESCKVTLMGDTQYLHVSKETYDRLMNGEEI